MSAIAKLTNNITNYIRTKSILRDERDTDINFAVDAHNHTPAVIVYDIWATRCKLLNLNRSSTHCLHAAFGIDLLYTLVLHHDVRESHDLLDRIAILSPQSVMRNIETLDTFAAADIVLRDATQMMRYLYERISRIHRALTDYRQPPPATTTTTHARFDVRDYQFENQALRDACYSLTPMTPDDLLELIDATWGSVFQCAFSIGWGLTFGGLCFDEMSDIGSHFALILRIVHDFGNIERDLEAMRIDNIVLCLGIEGSFELMRKCELKVLDIAISRDIYGLTLRGYIADAKTRFDAQLQRLDVSARVV